MHSDSMYPRGQVVSMDTASDFGGSLNGESASELPMFPTPSLLHISLFYSLPSLTSFGRCSGPRTQAVGSMTIHST